MKKLFVLKSNNRMKEVIKILILISLLIYLTAANSAIAIDFKITEVIPVEPIYSGGLTGPAQWSPDGTKLAYFSSYKLMYVDTLGKSTFIADIDIPPHRFVWASNSEILIFQREIFRDPIDKRLSSLNKMISVDINSGERDVLEENIHRALDKSGQSNREFKGPYLTVEGNPYYFVEEDGVEKIQMIIHHSKDSLLLYNNHIICHREDGLYIIQVDFGDSTRISTQPYHKATQSYSSNVLQPTNISFDQKYVMFGGTIIRLKDNKKIVLDTLIQKFSIPDGTSGCGFGDESFNPKYTEVAFNLSCDDGVSYISDRMGVFDYTTNQFIILDTLIGMSNCRKPEYSPNGKRFSFISEGNLYILNREVSDVG